MRRRTQLQLCLLLIALDVSGKVIETFIETFIGPNSWFLLETFRFGWIVLGSYPLIAGLLFLHVFGAGVTAVGLGRDHRSFGCILVGVKWGFGALWVLMVLGLLFPETVMKPLNAYRNDLGNQDDLIHNGIGSAISGTLKLIFVMSVASLSEEILYRGLLYKTLRVRMGPVLATVTSALCFLAPHGVASPWIFLMGCVNATLLEKYGSLVPGVIIHALWNIGLGVAGSLLFLLEVNAQNFFGIGFLVTFLISLSAWAALRIQHHEARIVL